MPRLYFLKLSKKPPEPIPEKDIYRHSRIWYIVEAALEYFISMIVTGAYLAKLTAALGLSDSLTGILSSFVSLGCTFQIAALFFFRGASVKRSVIFLHILNQLLFASIYVIPLLSLSSGAKTGMFIAALLGGYILTNSITAPKTNWLMSLVDDDRRGAFTANLQIVSLLGGMVFSLCMGILSDRLSDAGETRRAFILCAAVIFVLMLLHTLTLVLSKEKPAKNVRADEPLRERFAHIFKNPILIKVLMVETLWNIAHYVATPFYGTYQVHDLGFSMTFVAALGVLYSLVRAAASRLFGRYADRHSFAQMLLICIGIAALSFLVNTFCIPANGVYVYTLHYTLYAVSMAGIGIATNNLIFDYVTPQYRKEALAIKSAFSGTAGFLSTALASRLVSHIQAGGNRFLGIPAYAQQVMSALALLLCIGLALYIRFVILPLGKVRSRTNG